MCEHSTLNVAALARLHLAPAKNSAIPFTVELEENTSSDPKKGIAANEVPGAKDQKEPKVAVRFEQGRYPKLQSFKSAYSSDKRHLLLVGGRTAGLHTFYDKVSNFHKIDQNHVLFVVDLERHVTYGAALPDSLYESLSVMNTQAQQVGKYLYVVGGYGWSNGLNRNTTYDKLSVIDVDSVIAAIIKSVGSVPPIEGFVLQTSDPIFQITGGEMLFNPAKSELELPKVDRFYLIVGQYFTGNYDGSSSEKFKYARSILRFDVPSPVTDANGTLQLPKINAFILNAFNCTSDAHNAHSLDAQLARRDLTVMPTFLPQSFDKHEKKALPGALILSGVFQQDGSNAPFLQPIIFSFNQKDTTINPPNGQDASIATTIPSFQVGSFFQLYNNYSCASVQLFSPKDSAIYNILLGGVSYFYKSPEGELDQASNLFKIPLTADVSVVKLDNNGHYTQVLCPRDRSEHFFKTTGITSFGTEAIFLPTRGFPENEANLSAEVFDLDRLRSRGRRVKIGSIYGGIESTEKVSFPPVFNPKMTEAASRLIDVYVIFKE